MKKLNSYKKEQLFDKKTSGDKIASLFYKYPYTQFTLSEVSSITGVSKSMTSIILKEMEGDGLITIEAVGKKLWRVRANTENATFVNWKIINNLRILMETPIVGHLVNAINPKALILFGSFRWGQDNVGSDIDIALEILDDKEMETWSLSRLASKMNLHDLSNYTREFEKKFERNIQIHIFNRNRIDNNLFNNIANGIVLYGFLEVNK